MWSCLLNEYIVDIARTGTGGVLFIQHPDNGLLVRIWHQPAVNEISRMASYSLPGGLVAAPGASFARAFGDHFPFHFRIDGGDGEEKSGSSAWTYPVVRY